MKHICEKVGQRTENKRNQTIRNNRSSIVEASFLAKVYLITKKIEKSIDKELFITKNTPERFSASKLEEENRNLSEHEGGILIFDDLLDFFYKKLDPFLTKRRHEDFDVYYLSQSYFDLPKKTTAL